MSLLVYRLDMKTIKLSKDLNIYTEKRTMHYRIIGKLYGEIQNKLSNSIITQIY